jgi:hypothetical protein
MLADPGARANEDVLPDVDACLKHVAHALLQGMLTYADVCRRMLTYADVAHALLPGPEIAASTLVKPDVNTSLQKECLTVSSLFLKKK